MKECIRIKIISFKIIFNTLEGAVPKTTMPFINKHPVRSWLVQPRPRPSLALLSRRVTPDNGCGSQTINMHLVANSGGLAVLKSEGGYAEILFRATLTTKEAEGYPLSYPLKIATRARQSTKQTPAAARHGTVESHNRTSAEVCNRNTRSSSSSSTPRI